MINVKRNLCGQQNEQYNRRNINQATLLGQFCREMQDDYFVVFFSISDLIEMSDVNHVNILFAMAVKLMEEAETQEVKISSKIKEAFYLWFSKHTKTESAETIAKIIEESGGEVKADAWFVKFFTKLKATLQANAVIREEIKTEFSRRISDLIDRINDIATAIQAASEKEILVVIDDLDKLDLEIVDRVYRNNIRPLFQPQFRIIYTIPMAATRDMSLKGIIDNATPNPMQSMWATKFFPRGDDRNPSVLPFEGAVKIFEKILYKRLSPDLIEPEVTRMLILKSGGALRELIRLASRCCGICSRKMRQMPENQALQITDGILQKAVTDLRIEFTEPLGQNAYEVLSEVYRN